MNKYGCVALAAGLFEVVFCAASRAATPLPIENFARLPAIQDVSISPDGRYLAWLTNVSGTLAAVTLDRTLAHGEKGVLGADKKGNFQLTQCRWANNTRLVCSYRAMDNDAGVIFPITRLVAVDADGKNTKVLVQNGAAGASQFQDDVIDWSSADGKTVLIQADDNRDGFPDVYELNVYNGRLSPRVPQHEPIRQFISDGHGHVRLGTGYDGKQISYFAKLEGENKWRRLAKFDVFSATDALTPIAMSSQGNKIYASGYHNGREALWEMDLTDKEQPQLLFEHPAVDASDRLLTCDGRMLGIYYETDRPFAFYTDDRASAVIESVKKALPLGNFNSIVDSTRDENLYVIRSSSDVDEGSYYLFDVKTGKLQLIASAYPELLEHAVQLGRMQSISYPAGDKTSIPGYLTVPANLRAEKLPLIVMPHGGPIARDTWSFDWLVQFLVSRGYAVLQMNFRGSSGYGSDWLYAAHQDWGGLTYSDIADGTRWAIAQGIADPQRVCIVGWSFGGYAALLGAVRNSDLYRCAASIAGVSDLIEFESEAQDFANGAIAREQIGKNRDKLKLDSPRRHVEDVKIPVLMVHGTMDYQVPVEHSRYMAKALKHAQKPYKYVEIENANHQVDRESQRVTVLTELEAFLKENLGAPAIP